MTALYAPRLSGLRDPQAAHVPFARGTAAMMRGRKDGASAPPARSEGSDGASAFGGPARTGPPWAGLAASGGKALSLRLQLMLV